MRSTLQYLESTVIQHNTWHTGTGTERTGKKSYRMEEIEDVGAGRAEGSSAIGDGGKACNFTQVDVDAMDSDSLLQSLDTCLVALIYLFFSPLHGWQGSTDFILNGCCNLHVPFGSCDSKMDSASSNKISLPFPGF